MIPTRARRTVCGVGRTRRKADRFRSVSLIRSALPRTLSEFRTRSFIGHTVNGGRATRASRKCLGLSRPRRHAARDRVATVRCNAMTVRCNAMTVRCSRVSRHAIPLPGSQASSAQDIARTLPVLEILDDERRLTRASEIVSVRGSTRVDPPTCVVAATGNATSQT
jgi:hypothetical protein